MCPKTKEQYQEIREIRMQQIIDAALEAFTEKGYESASMSLVAKKAKISKGLIYNYFESKEDLLIGIVDQGIDEMLKYFDPNKDGFISDDEIIYFIDQIFILLENNKRFWKLYFALIGQPAVSEIFSKKMKAIMEMALSPLVDYYKRRGKENPEGEALLFGALLDGIGFQYILQPEIFPVEAIKKLIVEKFI